MPKGNFLEELRNLKRSLRGYGDVRVKSDPKPVIRKASGVKKKRVGFKEWFVDVADMVEDITGMGLEVFPDISWVGMYRDELTVDEAVQDALRIFEEADDDDGYSVGEDRSSSAMSFREWKSSVSGFLSEGGMSSLDEMRGMGLENSVVHQLYMDERDPRKAASKISDVLLKNTSRRKGQPRPKAVVSRDKSSFMEEIEEAVAASKSDGHRMGDKYGLSSLFDALGVKPKKGVCSDVVSEDRIIKKKDIESAKPVFDDSFLMSGDTGPAPNDATFEAAIEGMRRRRPAVSPLGIQFRPPGSMFVDSSVHIGEDKDKGKDEDDDNEAMGDGIEEEDDGAIDEIDQTELVDEGVIGGDFGRWSPATSAANATGNSIARALSTDEVSYKFDPDGLPQSSDGGTLLIFEMTPNKASDVIYYLVFQITGDKEDPSWNVYLRKGMGMASSSVVASERGVKSSDLKSAAASLKGKIG